MSSLIPIKNYINTVNTQENKSVSDKKHTNSEHKHQVKTRQHACPHRCVCAHRVTGWGKITKPMQYIPIVAEPKINTRGPQTTLLHRRRKEDFNASIKPSYFIFCTIHTLVCFVLGFFLGGGGMYFVIRN